MSGKNKATRTSSLHIEKQKKTLGPATLRNFERFSLPGTERSSIRDKTLTARWPSAGRGGWLALVRTGCACDARCLSCFSLGSMSTYVEGYQAHYFGLSTNLNPHRGRASDIATATNRSPSVWNPRRIVGGLPFDQISIWSNFAYTRKPFSTKIVFFIISDNGIPDFLLCFDY